MAMCTMRVTAAGALVGAGCHNLGAKEVIELFQTKKETKEKHRQRVMSNRYDKEMKVYTEGTTAMSKLSVHKCVMKDLNKIIDDETRALMTNTAKKKTPFITELFSSCQV